MEFDINSAIVAPGGTITVRWYMADPRLIRITGPDAEPVEIVPSGPFGECEITVRRKGILRVAGYDGRGRVRRVCTRIIVVDEIPARLWPRLGGTAAPARMALGSPEMPELTRADSMPAPAAPRLRPLPRWALPPEFWRVLLGRIRFTPPFRPEGRTVHGADRRSRRAIDVIGLVTARPDRRSPGRRDSDDSDRGAA